VAEDPAAPDVRIYRVRSDYATADLTLDAEELGLPVGQVREQYATDWREWPWEKGAPFTGIDNELDGGYRGQLIDEGPPRVYEILGKGNGVLDRGEDLNSNGMLDSGEDANGNGVLDGEVPGIAGADQVVWTVANDLSEGLTFSFLGAPPIGLEVQITGFGFNQAGALGNMVFKQEKIIYKGTRETPADARVDSFFIAQWVDPDLGTYSDDFVGVDTTLSLGFVYNSSSIDNVFNAIGLPPPAAGYDFFQGPLVRGRPGEDRNKNGIDDAVDTGIFNLQRTPPGFINLPMTSFAFFAAGSQISDPPLGEFQGTIEWINMLSGFIPNSDPTDPEPFTTAGGVPTKFPLAGDPVRQQGDLDGVILPPGDRRLVMSSGPFTLALGDTQEIVEAAPIVGLGSDRLSSVAVVKFFDRTAQLAFDNLFRVPRPPVQPQARATGLDGNIVLNWGFDSDAVAATEGQDDPAFGFKFEGYNVYQLKTPSPDLSPDNAIKLATFDRINEVTTILSEVFDQQNGVIIEAPVQVGTNSGIERSMIVERDAFRDNPLANDQDFFFAVTAYNFTDDPLQPQRSLESPPIILTVRAQRPDPGVRYNADHGQVLEVTHEGSSDGSITPIVVDPTELTGDTYQVTFSTNDEGVTVWDLTNVTQNEVLLADQTRQTGTDFLITDGFKAIVSGPPLMGLDWNAVVPEGERWLTGTSGAGGDTFFEGAFLGPNFTGSNLAPADFRSIRVEFFEKTGFTDLNGNGQYDIGEPYELDPDAGQMANSYSGFGAGNFLGPIQVPFRVFDMETDPPRQLTVVQRDRDQNGQWDLHKQWEEGDPNFVDVNGGDLRFNYIYILDTDYDPTLSRWDASTPEEDFFAQVDIDGGPVQWVLWLSQRGSREPLKYAFHMEFIAPNVNTEADVFTFTAPAPTFNETREKEDALEMVNVFPNPYLGFNRLETDRFSRFVRFNHLPEQAIIRIFTLGGTLVRTLEKNDPSQYLDWDLRNENNLPVASAIYVAHVEMPGLGDKILKLAIVQEEQFLQIF
ncbi:hypothetical protein GWN42_19380, partial [candidate division KSB1 bacterium]|nr:hypothetical protein [candidate division KSB1 bacterium]